MRQEFDPNDCFREAYEPARALFRDVCAQAGAVLESHANPNPAPSGSALTTDVARFGDRSARNLLVVVAGTHGNEGLCGSGCQIAWARSGGAERLRADTAVVFVHFVNPFGAAYLQRETEEGVDLNRNFVDHSASPPENPDYDELHEALTYPALSGPGREQADAFIADFIARRGEQAYLNAFASGQYSRPDGLYFGGRAPTWSNRTFESIVQRHAGAAERVAVVDIHTGFGPYGYGMLCTTELTSTAAFARAKAWYGESLTPLFGQDVTKVPPNVRGSLIAAVQRMVPRAEVTPAAIEFGTYELPRLIELRRAEAALKNDPKADPQVVRDYKVAQQKFLVPGTRDWNEMIWARASQVIRQALAGLGA
jgi:hypothetical protein